MRLIPKVLTSLLVVMTMFVAGPDFSCGQLVQGEAAPVFSLNDITGKTHDLSAMKDYSMIILYFFDVESRPSQEGLLSLDRLSKKYQINDLVVLGIAPSSSEKVEEFIKRTHLNFPVIADDSDVSNLYQARFILPTVCILGPNLQVMDYFQGGGKTTEIMLLKLAERKLRQNQTMVAKAISDDIIGKNPHHAKATMLKGYAELDEGSLDEAEETFRKLSHQKDGEILGKEGLASVYAKQGQIKKVLALAEEIEKKEPARAYVHLIKGDILYSQNNNKAAEIEYRKAVQKKEAEPFQKAIAYNQLGRLQANLGKYHEARELYDQAVDMDPYYIEAMSNMGVTYEKEGKWDKALDAYRKARSLDKNDIFTEILAKKAQEMLKLQRNVEQKRRIDKLVKELSDRYRHQKKSRSKNKDSWTSRPMVLSFVGFQEKGVLSQRDGFSSVLVTRLTELLNASGRVQVVERAIIDQLLEELNLGSSDLADQETALKLGRVLAAKLIGTGSLFHTPEGPFMSLRLIDTETSAIPKIVTKQLVLSPAFVKEIRRINREILKTVILKYPLCGYVMRISDRQVMINLGSKQGVVSGTKFDVIEEQKPIKYKGKMLHGLPKSIGRVEVTQVEPDLCFARVLNQERPIKEDDKLKEIMDELVSPEGTNE